MSCKDACLNRCSLINLGEALSHNIIKMKRLIAIEKCYVNNWNRDKS